MSTGSFPRSPASSGALAAWGIAILVVATVLLGALLPVRRGGGTASATDDPGCLEWSDGCRVCQRRAEGPACSLPGIACEPGPARCLRRGNG